MPANVYGSKWITPVRRAAIYLRDRMRCTWCGRDLTHARRRQRTLDHLDTRADCRERKAAGKDMHPSRRLVLSCRDCNTRKGDTPWLDWVWRTQGPTTAAETIRRVRAQVRRVLPLDAARELVTGENLDADLENQR